MISIEDIRKNLIKAIKTSKITQIELASKLNIKQPNIAKYLSGENMPSLKIFANICKILNLDANEILNIKQQ